MAIQIKKNLKIDVSKIKGRDNKKAAIEEVREYLEDTVLDYVSRGQSPVSGQKKFKPLSPKYKKIKSKITGSSKPNMELEGDMLDDFEVRTKGYSVSVGFHKEASDESKLKAENHNKFTVRSRKTKVPKRQFIPTSEQNFKPEIRKDIRNIVKEWEDASKDN